MSDTYLGQQDASSGGNDYTAEVANIQRLLARVETASLVMVQSCTNAGGISPVGQVNVRKLVHQVDGYGNAVPHTTQYALPYLRVQGGSNAFILDPKAGDLGLVVFCSRDHSTANNAKAPSPPGSRRTHDPSDGIYVGALLNGLPVNYVQMVGNDINVVSTGTTTLTVGQSSIAISASGIAITSGTLTHNGKDVGSSHEHTGVETGTGTSGPPA